jgi:hypothetical protein
MSQTSQGHVAKRRLLGFLLFGALLVGVAAILYVKKSSDVTRGLLLAAVSVALSTILIRPIADALLRPPRHFTVLKPSDVRSTRPSRLSFRKDRYSSPQFFRTPPYFIDLQRKYVVPRPELRVLVRKVDRTPQGLLLLEGPPASGKSYLLSTLEYELTRRRLPRRRRPIYTLTLKDLTPDQLPDVRSDLALLRRRSVLFVDDVHLYLSPFGQVAQTLRGKRILLIFATRPLTNYPQEQAAAIRDLKPEAYSLRADDIADDIVHRFLRVNEVREEEISRSQDLYQPYKRDLWALSTALEASRIIDGGPVISTNEINDWLIRNSLRLVEHNGRVVNRSCVLAPLAALYRFEVPVVRSFLTEQVGCNFEDVRYLLRRGEIVSNTDEFYALHHSSLANLLLAALATEEGLGLVPSSLLTRARSTHLHWQDAAVLWQVETAPLRAVRTIVGVARSSGTGRDLALKLLRHLESSHFLEAMQVPATDVETLGSFLRLWHELGRSLSADMTHCLRLYASEAPKQDVHAWAWVSCNLAMISPDEAARFVDVLAQLLLLESATTVADIGTTLSYVSSSLAARALGSLDHSSVVASLRAQSLPAEELAKAFAKLVWVNPAFASSIDRPLLDVFPDVDANTLPAVLSRLAWGNPEVARRLLEGCDSSRLMELLTAVDDPYRRYRAFASMANVSLPVARALVRQGALEWSSEVGMQALCNRILDKTISDSNQVHMTPDPTRLPEDSSLEVIRESLEEALAAKDTSELRRRLGGVRSAYSSTATLHALAIVHTQGMSEDQRSQIANWASEMMAETGARPDMTTAYLRANGLVKGSHP